MALDEVMLDDVAAGRRPPTLRIWEWAGSAVVMGRFQSLRNEVDAQAARRHGIEVVRRISGGGAMFIEPGNTITYSNTAPMTLVEDMTFAKAYAFMDQRVIEALGGGGTGMGGERLDGGGGGYFSETGNTITYAITGTRRLVKDRTFERAYAVMDQWVIEALGGLGIKSGYQPLNDITSSAGKSAGAAQTRRRGAVLHHVTMAYDIDAVRMLEVLRIGREKLSDKGTTREVKRSEERRVGKEYVRTCRSRVSTYK